MKWKQKRIQGKHQHGSEKTTNNKKIHLYFMYEGIRFTEGQKVLCTFDKYFFFIFLYSSFTFFVPNKLPKPFFKLSNGPRTTFCIA